MDIHVFAMLVAFFVSFPLIITSAALKNGAWLYS